MRVYNYVKEFCRRGHEVQVIAPLHVSMKEVYDKIGHVTVKPINEIKISRFEKNRELRYILYILLSAIRCLFVTRRVAFDALISHNCISMLGALPAAKLRRMPLILDLTDIMTGFFQFYKVPKPFRWFLRFLITFEVRLFRMADKIIVVSDALRDVLIASGIESGKITVIHDGVDTGLFNNNTSDEKVRREHHLGENPVILFMGLIDAYQGLDCLAKAASKVLAKFPSAIFLIVGSGTALNSVEELAKKLGVSNSFIFTGWVPHERIPEYVKCADVCVITHLPSFSNEVLFPVKLIEYWAMGKPVVAPKLRNIEYIVKDGETGVLYTPANSDELANHTISLLSNPSKARAIGENAMKLAVNEFSWSKLVSRVVNVCEQTCVRSLNNEN